MSTFYEKLAYKLTEWGKIIDLILINLQIIDLKWLLEMHKTQTDFNNNLTLKVFIFQFSNIFASLFYIAFLKGSFSGYPGNYNRIFGYRLEECTGGCLAELSQQLIIIMIGKQIISNMIEFIIPWVLILNFEYLLA